MGDVIGAEDRPGCRGLVPRVHILQMQDGQRSVGALHGQSVVVAGLVAAGIGDVQHDGDGPRQSVGQGVALADAGEILLADKALQRGEHAAGDVLHITAGVIVHDDLRKRCGLLSGCTQRAICHDAVRQPATMWGYHQQSPLGSWYEAADYR